MTYSIAPNSIHDLLPGEREYEVDYADEPGEMIHMRYEYKEVFKWEGRVVTLQLRSNFPLSKISLLFEKKDEYFNLLLRTEQIHFASYKFARSQNDTPQDWRLVSGDPKKLSFFVQKK